MNPIVEGPAASLNSQAKRYPVLADGGGAWKALPDRILDHLDVVFRYASSSSLIIILPTALPQIETNYIKRYHAAP
jgi:hypothetical protein